MQERLLVPIQWTIGESTQGLAEGGQNATGMAGIEKVDQTGVFPLHQTHFQCLHETADSEPEIVPYQDEALQALTITLAETIHQLTVILAGPGMEPLLKLIDHTMLNETTIGNPTAELLAIWIAAGTDADIVRVYETDFAWAEFAKETAR